MPSPTRPRWLLPGAWQQPAHQKQRAARPNVHYSRHGRVRFAVAVERRSLSSSAASELQRFCRSNHVATHHAGRARRSRSTASGIAESPFVAVLPSVWRRQNSIWHLKRRVAACSSCRNRASARYPRPSRRSEATHPPRIYQCDLLCNQQPAWPPLVSRSVAGPLLSRCSSPQTTAASRRGAAPISAQRKGLQGRPSRGSPLAPAYLTLAGRVSPSEPIPRAA